jgi:hypothetical protein
MPGAEAGAEAVAGGRQRVQGVWQVRAWAARQPLQLASPQTSRSQTRAVCPQASTLTARASPQRWGPSALGAIRADPEAAGRGSPACSAPCSPKRAS